MFDIIAWAIIGIVWAAMVYIVYTEGTDNVGTVVVIESDEADR